MKSTSAIIACLVIAASVCSIAATSANAAVTFQFTGTVTEIGPNIVGGGTGPTPLTDVFTVGESFVLNYTFDETTADTVPGNLNLSQYTGAITALSLAFDGGYALTGASGNLGVDFSGLGTLRTTYAAASSGSLSGASIGGFAPSAMRLMLRDSDGLALPSDALPTSLDFGAFDLEQDFGLDFGREQLRGSIDTFAVIPEPATLVLLGVGLSIITVRRQKR